MSSTPCMPFTSSSIHRSRMSQPSPPALPHTPSGTCAAAGVRESGPAARDAVGVQAGGPAAGDAGQDHAAGQADVPGRRDRLPVRAPAQQCPASILMRVAPVPLASCCDCAAPAVTHQPVISVHIDDAQAPAARRNARRSSLSGVMSLQKLAVAPQAQLVLAGMEPQHVLPRVQH